MWLVAGPNGSGKTTITKSGYIQRQLEEDIPVLDPDEYALALRAQGDRTPDNASLLAAQLSDQMVERLIGERCSFAVETVLSTAKFKPLVEMATKAGFSIGLTFVVLASPGLCIDRVRQRVQQGGHDVPPDKVLKRWARSIANLPWFAERAERVDVIDNSEIHEPVLIAAKYADGWHWYAPGRIPEIDIALGA